MKNIAIYLVLLTSALGSGLHAQDYATSLKGPGILHQYYINPILINPAYTGFTGDHTLFFNYRDQWADFANAPRSLTFSYNGAIGDRIGLGAMVFSDQFGLENRLRGQLSYAYRFATDAGKFSIGLSTEYMKYFLDNSALTDQTITLPDERIRDGVNGFEYFIASLGFYGEIEDKFIVGLSFPGLVQTRQDDNLSGRSGEEETIFNYIAYLGYRARVPEYDMTIEPILCVRQIGDIGLQIDGNLKLSFLDDRLFSGVTYGFGAGNRLGFMIGTSISNLNVFYSYDMSLLEFQQYNAGSHEISIGLSIPALMRGKLEE